MSNAVSFSSPHLYPHRVLLSLPLYVSPTTLQNPDRRPLLCLMVDMGSVDSWIISEELHEVPHCTTSSLSTSKCGAGPITGQSKTIVPMFFNCLRGGLVDPVFHLLQLTSKIFTLHHFNLNPETTHWTVDCGVVTVLSPR